MKTLKSYMITGIIFVFILGTLAHFLYDWSGNNLIVGIFTPINESIWEHTKLLFFPMLIYSFYLNKKSGKDFPRISAGMISGEIVGIILIVSLFYTYSGIIGYNVAFADISIFYISVSLAFYVAYKTTPSCSADSYAIVLKAIQFAIVVLYIFFTLYPPQIPLFISPESV